MSIDFAHFTPAWALAGGALIGLAAAVLILFNGRISGISGILGGLLKPQRFDIAWRFAFLAGMIGTPLLFQFLDRMPTLDIEAGWVNILVAGFLVGIGTRYAGGCTSGHGVCGLARRSLRSLVATLTFMAAGMLTVFVHTHWLDI
jgi:uncharacterized membrane protein YedE/YeeE